MPLTYNVRIYEIDVYKGKTTTTYWVQWKVAGKLPLKKEPFKHKGLAITFRSALISAARKGEAFDIATGRPVSMGRETLDMTCFELACQYVDLKWPRSAASTRKTNAEALTAVLPLLFKRTGGKPNDRLIRTALRRWAFNTVARTSDDVPEEMRRALAWVERNARPASDLSEPKVVRSVLDGLTLKLDGKPGSPVVVTRRRKIFTAFLEFGLEINALSENPWPDLKWTPPRTSTGSVDRRRVVNPLQAETLFAAVREQGRVGPRMVAFYETMYRAGLRPEEVVGLRYPNNLRLPSSGSVDQWGLFTLELAEPHVGPEWTDSGKNRDSRQLKQRAIGETRPVPCPPPLTQALRAHIEDFGLGPDGRLFVGERNKDELPVSTINRIWRWARKAAFTPEVYASPLAETPYDLRHAFISTSLNAGISPAQVAEWAGQSTEVMWRTYAACVDGGEAELRRRMEAGFNHRPAP